MSRLSIAGPEGPQGPTGPRGYQGIGVSSFTTDANHHLIVTLTDGTKIDAGAMPVGPKGDQGGQGPIGIAGTTGPAGHDGVGISNLAINAANRLIVTLTDGTKIDAGSVPLGPKGDKGDQGVTGVAGAKGDPGAAGTAGKDGIVPVYSTGGIVAGVKVWVGSVVVPPGSSTFTFDTSSAGFTSVLAFDITAYKDATAIPLPSATTVSTTAISGRLMSGVTSVALSSPVLSVYTGGAVVTITVYGK